MTDVLTQLPSKPQMLEWLDDAPIGSLLALIDLDDFRLLNQSLGHDVGDEALRLVAVRLRSAFPEPDHRVARLSQDEFAVLSTSPRTTPRASPPARPRRSPRRSPSATAPCASVRRVASQSAASSPGPTT